MNFVKNIRLIILIVLLLASVIFIIKPIFTKVFGASVVSVGGDSKCSLNEGDVIIQVGGYMVGNSVDFKNAEKTVKGGEYVTMVINNGPGGCVAARDGYLGVNVVDISSKHLNFGIDIQGGVENIFKPSQSLTNQQLNNVIEILNKRIKIINLPESRAYASNGDISIVGLSNEKIGMLVMPGEFEARISRDIKLKDDVGELGVGNSTYTVKKLTNTSLDINNYTYEIGQNFYLEKIKFHLINITNNSVAIEATVFTNDDIKQLLTAYGYLKYDSQYQRYEYSVPLEISNEASDRFVQITKKLPTTYAVGGSTLEGYLIYYLDRTVINKLSIPFEMMGKKIDNIQIIGFKRTMAEASNEQLKVEIAASGKLPTELKMIDTKYFVPILKEKVLLLVSIGMIAVSLPVMALSHLRYKKIKFGIFIILLSMAEVVCVLGAAAVIQTFYGYGWILDLASIIGLVVLTAFTGIQMILLSEKSVRKKDFSLHLRYKKMFNLTTFLSIVIFLLAFSMLFFWKGFGMSLVIGFIIGVLLTKPIYEEILKKSTAVVS
jgi:hypothetical protein